MPIFEYKCIDCGKKVEFLETGGRKVRKCPSCGSRKLQKQISTFAEMVKQGQSKRCLGCSDGTCPHAEG